MPEFPFAHIRTMCETTTRFPLSDQVVVEQFVAVWSSGRGYYTEYIEWYFKAGELIGRFVYP